MNIDNQLVHEHFETHLINEIDKNGYLVNNVDIENELEGNIVASVNFECHEDENEHDDNIVGKVFDTPEDTYAFYNRYALLHGFGIRIHWDFKNKITKEIYRKIFVCNKEGFKRLKSGTCGKSRRELRVGCKAKFRISKTKDAKWIVDMFDDTHNHELTKSPAKVIKHRSHSKLHRSMACKSLMLDLGKSGLRPSNIKKAINAMKYPFEANITSKQCVDVLSQQRKQYKDGRSRDAYLKFGDVVVFDVTYMTNRFRLPFAPFVGVNHHGQSILFGGALLENEKEESFQWLFKHFLKCMFNKYPSAIITDQDKAIGNAISTVFPNTRRRYCVWHIKRHRLEHLRPFSSRHSDFQESYNRWVNSDTIEEFETHWPTICDKYNLESSGWMMDMYNQRRSWVKAFWNDIFLAGMTTSQRSESIHSYFDGYVNSNTMLNEFVIQYDKVVADRRAAEEDEDFHTMNTMPVLSSCHPIEAKVGKCYTKRIFEVFKKEWTDATSNITHETLSKSLELTIYRVGHLNAEKKYWKVVKFQSLNEVEVTCSCSMFETFGILCKHILYVMKKKHVEILPDRYILPRWTLDSRYKVSNGSIGLEEKDCENEVSALTLWCVHGNYTKAIDQARDSPVEIK
uniref:protein FAR1-RELATED SEQUENCE 5-like n=1 Tax=Erigeron canadensis TaxID=72917 RepID=UPI001CB8B177|nr:protein FAR1-RELATED SEQUENCE 5-like [Erigeron canadensis]